MILHTVFCKVLADTSEAELARVFGVLAALKEQIEGLESYEFGPNIDLERKSQGFTHGFAMHFTSRAALEAYAIHPAHQAAGRDLVSICDGGADGIMVFDLAL